MKTCVHRTIHPTLGPMGLHYAATVSVLVSHIGCGSVGCEAHAQAQRSPFHPEATGEGQSADPQADNRRNIEIGRRSTPTCTAPGW